MMKLKPVRRLHALLRFSIFLILLTGTATLPAAAPTTALAAPAERPLAASAPSVSLNVPATAFIGQNVSFTVTFDNPDPSDPGYGPLIDLIIPRNGADGNQNTNPPLDGLTFVSATYLGVAVENTILTFPGSGGVTCVSHPYMRDNTGAFVQVCGNAGDTFVALRLPFGSFAPDQPPVVVNVTTSMSNLADLGTPLTIRARGGYQFGYTPLDDWCCGDDPSLTFSGWTNSGVTPTLFTLSKTYSGPEDETATGPNFPRRYTVTAEIAPGQTMTSFNLSDVLPDNMQFVSLVSTTPGGASCTPPSTSTPGGTLSCDFASVSGTVTMTFEYYIPLRDAGGASVIDPTSGDDALSCNNASGGGTWTPIDPRDTGGTFTQSPAGCEHTLADKSIAIQKNVNVIGGGNPAPGKYLEYTLDFQVSDFFAFDNIVITDVISDGQHFDSSFTPTLQINGNTYTLAASGFAAANYDVVCNYTGGPGPECTGDDPAANDGATTLTFRVSSEIITRGQDGRLIGGCVPTTGTGGGDPSCGSYDDGPTTGRIVFRTLIQQDFTDTYPSGDPSVDQGDVLADNVTIAGNLLSTSDASTPTGQSEADTSAASAQIGRGNLIKSIYAVNGSTSFSTPVEVSPGDTVTYRLTYTLPTGDVENMEFDDYLPLPVFHVGDPDEDGLPGPAWTFDPTVSAAAPAAGVAKFGPSDTFYAYSSITPTVTSNTTNNRLNFFYGDFDGPTEQTYTVDILFTVTVSDDPFADRLYLTNQAHAFEGSTNAGTADANAIVQIILTEPVLVTSKSAIWTSNTNATFLPATPAPPVTFLDPTNSPRWSGTINSTNLHSGSAFTIDHDVVGVDAGDIVTFAIVIENQGSSLKGAFDIDILDTLPAGFQIPAGGLNLQIYYGDGSGPIAYTRPDGSPAAPADLFGTGIRLVDPVGQGVCSPHDPNLGNNVILITYDLEASSTIAPGTITNTGTIIHYAGDEGGPNHVPTPSPIHDDANATTLTSMTKALTGTEITNSANSATQVVIGEYAIYTLVVTVPEGTVPGAQIVDTLDAGLAFLDLVSVTVSDPADMTSTVMTFDPGSGICTNCIPGTGGGSNPLISSFGSGATAPGRRITFNLGNLTNADRNNSVPETLTIVYRVIALNTSGNQHNTQVNNSAVYSWTGGSQPAVSAANVQVREPVLTITKSIVPNTGDAGDSFTYTITISGPTITDAFDVTLDDSFPLLMENIAWGSVTDTAGMVTQANFSLTGNNTIGYTLSTVTPWDMLLSQTPRTITLTFTGTVSYLANPQQTIDNVASVRWTSLDGDFTSPRSTFNVNSTERTGAGGINDYLASNPAASARFTVDTVTTDKYVVLTSEASTADNTSPWYVTIGEVVRFRIIVPIPEGTSPNFQVRDNLPNGLTFLDDGTARLTFVSNGAGITSSGVGIVQPIPVGCTFSGNTADANSPARPLLCALDDSNVGSDNSTVADPDSFATGTDVWFKLGTLLNSDSDADQEFVVIEFNALVDNTSTGSNDAGEDRANTFDIFINGVQIGSTSTAAAVRIAEPSITDLLKTAVPASGDAGDQITYTLTFSNAGGANNTTAFDVRLTDTLPAQMTYDAGSMNISSAGNCASGVTDNTVAPNIEILIDVVPAGCSVTVTYTATLNASATPEQVIANTADLTYTSLPGPNGTTGNVTGSDTPGASGTDTGERDGSAGARPWNDYYDQAGDNVTVPGVTITKQIAATSAAHTSGSDLAIGEEVTYAILLTFPEGTTPADTVFDDLPTGLAAVLGSPEIITSAAASGGLLTADFNGTIGSQSTLLVPGDGGSVQFNLSDVVAAGDNNPNNNTILLRFRAQVTNILANQAGTVISNEATNQVGANPVTHSNSVDVTVVEPSITFNKTIVSLPTPLDAGGVVHYRITFANATGATVSSTMDVHITDALAAALLLPSTGAPDLVITPSGSVGAITNNSTTSNIDITIASVAPGASVTIDFYPVIQSNVTPGQLIDNLGDADWTSLSGTVSGERDGSDGPGGALNDYAAQSPTVSFNIADPAFSKSIDHTSAPHTVDPSVAIGEIITFRLEVTLPEGTTSGITINDDLPAGLRYVLGSASLDDSGFNGVVSTWSVTPTVPPVGSGDDLLITIGQVTVAADNDDTNNTFFITFEAVVLDESGNQASPPPLVNSATMSIAGVDYTDTASANIVESTLTILKTVDDDLPAPGQILTFTVTVEHDLTSNADAFDVIVTDNLPAGLDLLSVAISASGGLSGVVDNSDLTADQMRVDVASFPLGGSLTITYQALVTAPFGTALNNTADVTWTSLPGPQPDERTGADGPGGPLDDYAARASAALNSDRNLVKRLVDDSYPGTLNPDATIGEILTFELTLTIPANSTDTYLLTDTLASGLAFVDCEYISAGPDLSSSQIPLNPLGPCNHGAGAGSNPLISNSGRTVRFNFGTITNAHPTDTQTIVLRYRVVVLDVTSNVRNVTLDNSARLEWSVGSVTRTIAPAINILEPDLDLEKTVNRQTATPGLPLVFTVRVFHTANSQMDGFDVVISDLIPEGLTYVPGTLQFVVGSGVPPTTLDDTIVDPVTGRTLLRAVWDVLPLGSEASIQFTARFGNIPPGGSVINIASVEWTSLPGEVPAPPATYLSAYEQLNSHERRYDPLNPADVYRVQADAAVRATALPSTGFAPGRVTVLPPQTADQQYSQADDLRLEIPALGLNLPIVGVPLGENGWDVTWLWNQIGYLEGSAYPGRSGNSVLTAHVYTPDGLPGPFVNLASLRYGDQIILHSGGQRYIYEVRSNRQVLPANMTVLQHEDYAWLTLITCRGYNEASNTYRYRQVVRAVLVRIELDR
ncbi:MAG: sortase [Anaerolineales bacterium]